MDTLEPIIQLISTLGINGIFLWLFIGERNSHDKTRQEYRDDLREIAGLPQSKVNLRPVESQMDRDGQKNLSQGGYNLPLSPGKGSDRE